LQEKNVRFAFESPPLDGTPLTQSLIALLSVIAFPLTVLALVYFLVLRPAQSGRPLASMLNTPLSLQHEILDLRAEVADLRAAVKRLEDEIYAKTD
jgi:hypothetical protein